jgi:hypothetical protein
LRIPVEKNKVLFARGPQKPKGLHLSAKETGLAFKIPQSYFSGKRKPHGLDNIHDQLLKEA